MTKLGNILIIGDSYSTFPSYIPVGNHCWYAKGGHDETDVAAVEDTWWHQLINEAECNLVLNESFSGATVCNTERPTIPHTSFVHRLNRLIERGFFDENKIDTVLYFGGTNDSWIDSPIGENKYGELEDVDLDFVLPAFCYCMGKLKSLLPDANIIPIINCDLKDAITEGFKDACAHFGLVPVVLEDISKQSGHPDREGMRQIKEQVKKRLTD